MTLLFTSLSTAELYELQDLPAFNKFLAQPLLISCDS